jgi:general stress protein 26
MQEVADTDTLCALWDDSWKKYYPEGRDGGDFSVLEFMPKQFKSYNGNGFVKAKGTVEL